MTVTGIIGAAITHPGIASNTDRKAIMGIIAFPTAITAPTVITALSGDITRPTMVTAIRVTGGRITTLIMPALPHSESSLAETDITAGITTATTTVAVMDTRIAVTVAGITRRRSLFEAVR